MMSADTVPMQEDVCQEHVKPNGSTRKRMKYQEDHVEKTQDGGFKIKTYRPTLEEMKDFSAYMRYIHEDGGHRAGLAKIIPPDGYMPRKSGYDDESLYEMEISCPIRQEVSGEGGLYQQMNIVDKKKMTVRNFKRLSEDKHPTPVHDDQKALERNFWKNVFTNPSIYGADVPGTLFDQDFDLFNLTKLNTILDDIQNEYGVTIQGVNTTYLYFGMWKSSFCWHTEDMDLYSINYLHTGAEKSWYCIAPEFGRRFERLAESFFPHSFKSCKAFLRHKTTLISPAVLRKYSIPFSREVQKKGEFMVTFPYSYHSGFNNGFNIAEATNFATEHWIDFGKWATRCECSAESVKISMQTFVKRYQSERYENWILGRDVCKDPRDPKHVAAAPKPTEHDLFVMGIHDRYNDGPFEDMEEEDDKRIALQQNQSSNLKNKSRSLKKPFKSIEESCRRYSEFLLARDNYKNLSEQPIDLPHYTPIPADMVATTDIVPVRSGNSFKLPIKPEIPDYDDIIKKAKKNREREKREKKLNEKKEQRARERIAASHELLQFLPVTFTLEKKFNRCIAAHPPHCAVCQILVPHPKDDENIWGTKSTSIETATSPSEKQTDLDSQETTILSEAEAPMAIDIKPTIAGKQVEEFKLPTTSKVLLPRSVLSDHAWHEHDDEIESLDGDTAIQKNKKEDEASSQIPKEADSGYEERIKFLDINTEEPYELLQCTVCMLSVHSICYGVDKMLVNKESWRCDRCLETTSNRSIINCALCPCRGGALKPLKGTWVHITCALTLLSVKLTDLMSSEEERKKKIKLPDPSCKQNCAYCYKNITKAIQGKCLPCVGDGYNPCNTNFHPTCGHRNGAQFEVLDHHIDPTISQTMIARCSECIESIRAAIEALNEDDDDQSDLEPLDVGTQVIAFSKRGNYYDGRIQSKDKRVTYELFFPGANEIDISVPERSIIHTDKSKEYKVGDRIKVKMSDREMIGKFRRKRCNGSEYLVKFAGGTVAERVSRKDIYLNIDQMPEEKLEQYLLCAKRLEVEDEWVT